jgi:hypothetical protein
MRRIGVLLPHNQDSPVGQARIAALLQEPPTTGLDRAQRAHDIHWAGADSENIRKHAAKLALAPDVILVLPVGLSPLVLGAARGRRLCLPDGRRWWCRFLRGRLDFGFGELAPQVC